MDYIILESPLKYELEALVRERIGEGWQPLGGVACAVTLGPIKYFQAMTLTKYGGGKMEYSSKRIKEEKWTEDDKGRPVPIIETN